MSRPAVGRARDLAGRTGEPTALACKTRRTIYLCGVYGSFRRASGRATLAGIGHRTARVGLHVE
ncbi:MAG: hypothetical protein V3T97_05760 [Gemmatimonadota bacterium]